MADEPDRKPHLTDADVAILEKYVATLQSLLNLTHWTVWVDADPSDDDCHASIHPVEGRFVATLAVAADWATKDEDIRRNTIVHELLHLVHRDQTDVVRCGLQDSGYLPAKAFSMLWRTFALHTEGMVDHLAGVLSAYVPHAPEHPPRDPQEDQ